MDKLKRAVTSWPKMVRSVLSSVPRRWHVWAWTCSLGLGITGFLSLTHLVRFDYHLSNDITATPAFLLYPEQQDFWFYLLGLGVVPFLTGVGYGIWAILVTVVARIQDTCQAPDAAWVSYTCLLWWAHPLSVLYNQYQGAMPIYAVGGLFVLANGAIIGQRWAIRYPKGAMFRDWKLQGMVAALGAAVVVWMATSPATASWIRFPARWFLGGAAVGWGLWLGGSYLLSHLLNQGWPVVAERLALGLSPLSLLPLQAVLWWEAYQGSERVAVYELLPPWVVPVLTLIASAGGAIWSLCIPVSVKGFSPSSTLKRCFFLLTVPILLYSFVYDPNIHYPLDLFHEGERVSPAQALMSGQVPYKDVVFVHGFFRDPGVALAAFRLFGVSMAGLRMLERLLNPLSIVITYYFALASLGETWALLYSGLALTGFWPIFYDFRIVPLMATLICLVVYVRRRRLVWAIGGGFCAWVTLATSFDVGTAALAAGTVFCAAFSIVEWKRVKLSPLVGYLSPFLSGTGLVAGFLGLKGAWPWFWKWPAQILAVYRDWNGMPFPVRLQGLDKLWVAWLSPAASVIGLVVLAVSILKKRWSASSWLVLLLLLSNVLLFNRGIVSGYSHFSALEQGAHLAPLLLLCLLDSSDLIGSLASSTRQVIQVVLSLALLVPTPLHASNGRSVLDVLNRLPLKHRVEIPSGWVQPPVARVGPIFLPPEQANSLTEIVGFLEKAESFWDFTDHGALYFLSGRPSPVRFYATHHVVTKEDQQEVIASFEQSPPRFILFRSGTGWDAIVGIDRTLRSLLLSEYLLKHYRPFGQVGGFTILERGAPSAFPAEPRFHVNLGYIPYLWGRDRFPELSRLHPVSVKKWDFVQEAGLAGWGEANQIAQSRVTEQGWDLLTAGSDPWVWNLDIDLDPRSVTYLAVWMQTWEQAGKTVQAQFFWHASGEDFTEPQSVTLGLVSDGQPHLYLVRLASFPSWAWSDRIAALRFDPADAGQVRTMIRSIEFIQMDELTQVNRERPWPQG